MARKQTKCTGNDVKEVPKGVHASPYPGENPSHPPTKRQLCGRWPISCFEWVGGPHPILDDQSPLSATLASGIVLKYFNPSRIYYPPGTFIAERGELSENWGVWWDLRVWETWCVQGVRQILKGGAKKNEEGERGWNVASFPINGRPFSLVN